MVIEDMSSSECTCVGQPNRKRPWLSYRGGSIASRMRGCYKPENASTAVIEALDSLAFAPWRRKLAGSAQHTEFGEKVSSCFCVGEHESLLEGNPCR